MYSKIQNKNILILNLVILLFSKEICRLHKLHWFLKGTLVTGIKTYLGVDPCKGFSKAFRTTSPVINENNVQNIINLQYDIRMDIINGINHKAKDVTI